MSCPRLTWLGNVGLICATIFCLALSASAGEAELLGHWRFDEGEGDVAVDSSGHENDGEISGANWVRGKFGTALRFDGQGSHVVVPQLAGLDGSDAMTVETWVLWEDSRQYPNILTGGVWSPGGFLVFVDHHHCSFRMGQPGIAASQAPQQWREVGVPMIPSFALAQWYHLAATLQRPLIKTYVNGQEVGSGAWDHPVGHQGDLLIGKWSGTTSHWGLIDEVKIFRRALSAEEIATDYQAESPGRESTGEGGKIYEIIPRHSQLAKAVATFETDDAQLAISSRGRCVALIDKRTGEDQLAQTAPLVSLRIGQRTYERATCRSVGDRLVIHFPQAETTVVMRVDPKPHYFVWRVESVDNPQVDEVTFLQLKLKSCQHVNATSGLAASEQFAVCLRTLTLGTLVQVVGNPPRLTASVSRERDFAQGQAALATCSPTELMRILQDLVREEKVPHSTLGGPYSLGSQGNRGSYVFATVSERDVDHWIRLAHRAGMDTVHLSGWEQSLGHYEPREDLYPQGLSGLKSVADKLHAAGLKVGIHTLTGCISPHDRWASPVPDPRLATDGTFPLASDLSETDTDVYTTVPPGDLSTVWAYSSRGNCIRIDDELILYSAISNQPPFGLLKCTRGAFGTRVAAHRQGAPVHHMYTRYGGFVADENTTLVDDLADRIAGVYNACDMDQIYMDGAEAMRGWYGIARMRQAIFTRLQRPALVEASCWDHHSWPFHSRVGAWDHPKWGLKRFADDHLRSIEQYRREYLLEGQLGWWVILGPDRDWNLEMPDEIEYLCVKALAYDVPSSFQDVTATGTPPNARQNEYLTMIGRCERLRLANYFTEAVKETLRRERDEFRLVQAEDGQWEFIPTDYLEHQVTGEDNGTNTWTVTNRHAAQPLRVRIEALYAAHSYDDSAGEFLADLSSEEDFGRVAAASQVRMSAARGPAPGRGPGPGDSSSSSDTALRLTAANDTDSTAGAWGRVEKRFDPLLNMTPFDAFGLWVHGDGSGALLNLQLTNLPDYFDTLDDHHVKLDFTGWRYFELFLRERDAAAYHDYQWPYGAHCVLHRSPLVRQAVSRLTLYLNNIPAQGETTCYLSPIRALRTRKAVLHRPAIEVAGKRLVFPVDLESGMFLEFESPDDCRLYNERGDLVTRLYPEGDVPVLSSGDNQVAFSCQQPGDPQPADPRSGDRGSRAEITMITCGSPVRGCNSRQDINWELLRREDEPPRTITALDGRQNTWTVLARPGADHVSLEFELSVEQVGGETSAYEAPAAVTLESFDTQPAPGTSTASQTTSFVYDAAPISAGCSPAVTQSLMPRGDIVKLGPTSVCYQATSERQDDGGWSVKCRSFPQPLDLTKYAAIGFWLHGDGGGQLFKLQLMDAAGGWQDMYTRVDFSGWRYCQFDLGNPSLKDLSRITAMNIYYNALPAGKTVQCHVDEIRLLAPSEPIRDPVLTVADQMIQFPVALYAGDKLVMNGQRQCTLYRKSGTTEPVTPVGGPLQLLPGRNPVTLTLPTAQPRPLRVVVELTKLYP